MLTACPQKTAIWISSETRPNQLVFGVGQERGRPGGVSIGVIRVDRCGGKDFPSYKDAMWVLGVTAKTMDLRRLVYGDSPTGFEASHGPLPLTEGCYEASLSGTGSLRFDVDSQGMARERPSK